MTLEKNFAALKSLKKPDAVIFDWDNTLVDSWPLIHQALNEAMRAFGKEEWSFEYVKDNVHKAMRYSFPEIFGDGWQEAGAVYKKAYRSRHLECLELLDGARDLIAALEAIGAVQFVVSNKIGLTLRKEVDKLGLAESFFSVVGSLDADADKPDVAPVELALRGSDIDLKRDHVWFVGDTIADVDCAYNCGAQPIIFGHDGGVSKTIAPEIYKNGRGEGAIPLFLKHGELVAVVKGF